MTSESVVALIERSEAELRKARACVQEADWESAEGYLEEALGLEERALSGMQSGVTDSLPE